MVTNNFSDVEKILDVIYISFIYFGKNSH